MEGLSHRQIAVAIGTKLWPGRPAATRTQRSPPSLSRLPPFRPVTPSFPSVSVFRAHLHYLYGCSHFPRRPSVSLPAFAPCQGPVICCSSRISTTAVLLPTAAYVVAEWPQCLLQIRGICLCQGVVCMSETVDNCELSMWSCLTTLLLKCIRMSFVQPLSSIVQSGNTASAAIVVSSNLISGLSDLCVFASFSSSFSGIASQAVSYACDNVV